MTTAGRGGGPAVVRLSVPAAALVAAAGLFGCGSSGSSTAVEPIPSSAVDVPSELAVVSLGDGECSGTFVAQDLPHVTKGPGATSSTFDGTGAGIALGDLDGDGDLDVVAPNLSGESSILWQDAEGYRAETLEVGRFRQATTLDVEGDGDLDIVLTTGIGPPLLFRNTAGAFTRERLPGVDATAYSMAWSDLSGDGDLDVVTGSYNAELSIVRNSPVLGSDTGVVLHERTTAESYMATRLAADAQALAVLLVDVDGDGRLDVVVGNDLATPDGVWIDNDGGWLEIEPFTTTSLSTMSLDAADVDGDGDLDLFSTDMKPRADDLDPERYVEVERDIVALGQLDEVQIPANVLSLSDADGFADAAVDLGVDATGWSWAGLFGDLDSDGRQDLYVVTGMRSDQLFSALPGDLLVEPNQAFANTGDGFELRPDWGLDDLAGGRGMAMGDVDGDGDLDVVVNNLDEPARLFENQLCGGSNLLVDLEWPGTANVDAIGALVVVESGDDRHVRQVDVSRGYLSGLPTTVHVGLGDDSGPVRISVRWPDGTRSDVDDVPVDHRVTITRADG
ncbi:MAG: CRTAC1 family protein [Actinomycetota bacterium]